MASRRYLFHVSFVLVGAGIFSAVLGLDQFQAAQRKAQVAVSSKIGVSASRAIFACPSDPADATLILKKQSDGTYFAHVDSAGTAYSSSGSPYFIVDVVVPAAFKMDHTEWVRIRGFQTDYKELDVKTVCPKGTMSWAVFKRTPKPETSSYSHPAVLREEKKGTWFMDPDLGEFCDSGVQFNFKVPTPESKVGQAVVYRVIVMPKFSGQVRQATVSWSWSYGPNVSY